MTSSSDPYAHPITSHLRQAGDHIRLANHASHSDRREITDLYDTLGALTAVLERLPELISYLHRIIDRTDASGYETDCGDPAAETLNTAELAMDEAFSKISTAATAVDDAWSAIGRLRHHDTDDNVT